MRVGDVGLVALQGALIYGALSKEPGTYPKKFSKNRNLKNPRIRKERSWKTSNSYTPLQIEKLCA